jgi:hypothetical protein
MKGQIYSAGDGKPVGVWKITPKRFEIACLGRADWEPRYSTHDAILIEEEKKQIGSKVWEQCIIASMQCLIWGTRTDGTATKLDDPNQFYLCHIGFRYKRKIVFLKLVEYFLRWCLTNRCLLETQFESSSQVNVSSRDYYRFDYGWFYRQYFLGIG